MIESAKKGVCYNFDFKAIKDKQDRPQWLWLSLPYKKRINSLTKKIQPLPLLATAGFMYSLKPYQKIVLLLNLTPAYI